MRRSLVATCAILLLLGGLWFIGYRYQRRAADAVQMRSFADQGARSFIQTSLNLILAEKAGEIYAVEESAGATYRVLARFDVPPLELPSVLQRNAMLPGAGELKEDDATAQWIASAGDPGAREWWRPDALKGARCGQRSGRRRQGTAAAVDWRVGVCAGAGGGGYTRVYVVLEEGPAPK
jgi:hypothetical protein